MELALTEKLPTRSKSKRSKFPGGVGGWVGGILFGNARAERNVLSINSEMKNSRRAAENGFRGTKSNSGKPIGRKQNSEERQARLAKVEGLSLNGGFEQMRSGWPQSGNKPACFECGNTDRFKANVLFV